MLRRHVANNQYWLEGKARSDKPSEEMAKQAKEREDKVRSAAELRCTKAEKHAWRGTQEPECLLDEDYLTATIEAEGRRRGARYR